MPYVPRLRDYVYPGPGNAEVKRYEVLTLTSTRRSNGNVTYSQSGSTLLAGRAQRQKPTKGNRKQMGSRFWRDPTTYYTQQVIVDWSPGEWERFPVSGTYSHQKYSGFRESYSAFDVDGWPPRMKPGNTIFDDNVYNLAVQRALGNIHRDKVHFLTALAESKKAYGTMVRRFTDLGTALLNAKRGKWRRGTRETPHGLFLEWYYGWRPMCNDLFNAYDSFQRAVNPPLLLSVEGSAHESGSGVSQTKGYHIQHTGSFREFATCKLVAKLSDKYKSMAQGFGLNPLTTAWELVPWSFVVDWVIPVGSFLENLTATSGLTLWSGYKGRGLEASCSGERNSPAGYTTVTPQTYEFSGYEYRRTKLSSFPVPMPVVKSPFSKAHGLAAAALSASLLDAKLNKRR